MIAAHVIQDISFENNNLCIKIDGKNFKIPLEKISNRLKNASEIERNLYKVSPSGYGIHWPLIDEDLSVDALLAITKNL